MLETDVMPDGEAETPSMIPPSGTPLERLWEFVARASPNGLLIVAADGRILVANRALEQQFGYGGGELIGQSVEKLVPGAVRPNHVGWRGEFPTDPEAPAMGPDRLLSGIRNDGSQISVEISLNPLETEQGPVVVASVVD